MHVTKERPYYTNVFRIQKKNIRIFKVYLKISFKNHVYRTRNFSKEKKSRMNAPKKYILLEWAGDSLCNRVPVLARRAHCVFFEAESVPLTALHDQCTPFSSNTRSTSSPVRGSDRVRPWQIFNGSWKSGYPVGNDSVRWCLMTRTGFGLSVLSVSVLFWMSAVEDNDKRQVKHMAPCLPGAVMMGWCENDGGLADYF